MAEIIVPNEPALQHNLAEAKRALESGATEAQLIARGISRSAALVFMEKCEQKGFTFVGDEASGDLYFFRDSSGPHESAAIYLVLPLTFWLLPWSLFGNVLRLGGSRTVHLPGVVAEPDASLRVRGNPPHVLVQVAYRQSRADVIQAMSWFAAPSGPARLVLGVDVEYPPPAAVPPRIDVFLLRPGQQADAVTASCGAGSGCIAPALRDYTIFLPIDDVFFGVSWFTRTLISIQLAVLVPLYSLYGCVYAVYDVLSGRRSVWQLAKACIGSVGGPWWGVVPLDTFQVRESVFMDLHMHQQVRKLC